MGAVLLAAPVVRRLDARDLPEALRLTQELNWSHRLADWDFHFRLGRGWAACDADGRLLGTALWWAYGPALGAVGLVVVRPDCQGRGIGRRLMDAIIGDAGDRTLQLAATQAGLRLYEQCGFVAVDRVSQCQGVVRAVPVPVPDDVSLREFVRADLAAACRLDQAATGAPRDELIEAVFDQHRGAVVAERAGALAGFAMQRAFGRGTLIGPVIAADESIAVALSSRLLAADERFCRLDIPSAATSLADCLARSGLPAVDEVIRMIRGPSLQVCNGARTFGLVSQALN
jgi:GNAT superfamily N-acetyltransferase